MKMLKKFSEAQEKGYNYMLFIELGYLTSKNDLSTFQVKAVTIEGYFETIKQIYDYIDNINFEETKEKVEENFDILKKVIKARYSDVELYLRKRNILYRRRCRKNRDRRAS